MRLATGTWVIVCDGQKYLLLENEGDQHLPNLEVVAQDEVDRSTLRTEGLERPGRFRASESRRGSGDTPSLHDLAEHHFVVGIAASLDNWAKLNRFKQLVIIADKKTLGLMRKTLTDNVLDRVVREAGNDIVHMAIPEIEAFIQDI